MTPRLGMWVLAIEHRFQTAHDFCEAGFWLNWRVRPLVVIALCVESENVVAWIMDEDAPGPPRELFFRHDHARGLPEFIDTLDRIARGERLPCPDCNDTGTIENLNAIGELESEPCLVCKPPVVPVPDDDDGYFDDDVPF